MKLLLLFLFFSFSVSFPIQDAFDDSWEEDSISPSSISTNLTMCMDYNFCNYGKCVLLINKNVSCKCDKPYVDHAGQFCVVKGKSKLTAFLLSFLCGGLGADWFYMSSGDATFICVGIIKVFMFTIFPLCFALVCFLGMIICGIPSDRGDQFCVCVLVGVGIFWLSGGIWWFVDWVRIVTDGWGSDGRGVWIYVDM